MISFEFLGIFILWSLNIICADSLNSTIENIGTGANKVYILVLSDAHTPETGEHVIRPSMECALDWINQQHIIDFDTYTFRVVYAECDCEQQIWDSLMFALKQYSKGELNAVFGPFCQYSLGPIGRSFSAKYFHTPVFGPAFAYEFDQTKETQYNTLTKTVGISSEAMADLVYTIMKENNWRRLALIYDEEGPTNGFKKYYSFLIEGIVRMSGEWYPPVGRTRSKRKIAFDIGTTRINTVLKKGKTYEQLLNEKVGTDYAGMDNISNLYIHEYIRVNVHAHVHWQKYSPPL